MNGVHDPTQGATNMQTLVADTGVIGVVGPFNSNVAKAEIPVFNGQACSRSPANTNNGVTQPPEATRTARRIRTRSRTSGPRPRTASRVRRQPTTCTTTSA